MNYGDLLSEAFRLAWRNRFLWFFGFFVAGGGGSFNFPANFGGQVNLAGPVAGPLRMDFDNLVLFLTVVISVIVVLALIFLVLSMISQGALAESVAALHRGETRSFGSAFRIGTANFWRVFGLKVLFFLIALGLVLVIFLPVVLGAWPPLAHGLDGVASPRGRARRALRLRGSPSSSSCPSPSSTSSACGSWS